MNFETLQRELVALRLVEPGQLDGIVLKLRARTADALFAALEADNVLTPFISQKLRKGETDGIVMGDYKLMYRNASGSFARVYRAQSLRDGSMVGLKVLRQRWADDPKSVAQFHAEAKLGTRLRHPNIAPIYEDGITGKNHWFSMEFVEGGNLREFIGIRGRLDPAECTKYLLDMARGLEYALGMGFTHRDLKMTNVLVSSAGVVKLIDFGLAGQGPAGGHGDSQDRAIEYATIEKANHAPPNDPRSDLFFLGTITYELLAGQPPYPRTREREERAAVGRYRDIRPIREVAPDAPASLLAIVDRLLEFDPARRYQHPREVVGAAEVVQRELESGTASGGARTGRGVNSSEPAKRSVLCVEDRSKHLNMLRDYFTKHGYRLMAVSDPGRALDRLERNPPDCLVLMGGAMGDVIVETYERATERADKSGTAVVAVLSESQADLEKRMKPRDSHPVLARIATLRDLRSTIDEALAARNGGGSTT